MCIHERDLLPRALSSPPGRPSAPAGPYAPRPVAGLPEPGVSAVRWLSLTQERLSVAGLFGPALLTRRSRGLADALESAHKELGKPKGLPAAFGIDRDIEAFFRTLALWSPCSEDDANDVIAAEFGEAVSLSIPVLLKYGAWMGVLQRDADLKYAINPLLQKTFIAGAE